MYSVAVPLGGPFIETFRLCGGKLGARNMFWFLSRFNIKQFFKFV